VGFGYPANAAIDELNFYQAELTPAQVAQKYAAGLSAKLQLSNPALPRIGVGGYAEVRLEANSGVPPYAFSAGAVPAGVTLDGDRLRLAPQSAGAFPLALTVTDASGATATRTLTLQVDAPTVVPA